MIRRLLAYACLLAQLVLPLAAPAAAAPLNVAGVDAIGFTVGDLERSVAFYSQVLSFTRQSELEVSGSNYEQLEGVRGSRVRVVRMALGTETIELTRYLAPKGRAVPEDSRSNDLWFQHIAIVVSDIDRAYQRLRQYKVEQASPEPQRLPDWNVNAGGIRAFYFRDPDGHFLELIQFPPGKGDPRWQQADGRLFLGIDHTAIVVSDTTASLALYRDRLGLVVTGESENFGPEQERLNHVTGAHLRITGLRAAAGPGIELLEYLLPRDGRRIELQANDSAHWQTRLIVPALAGGEVALRSSPFELVSPKIVSLDGEPLGFRAGILVRDRDGHALQLVAH